MEMQAQRKFPLNISLTGDPVAWHLHFTEWEINPLFHPTENKEKYQKFNILSRIEITFEIKYPTHES
jgi:hypothetical protein